MSTERYGHVFACTIQECAYPNECGWCRNGAGRLKLSKNAAWGQTEAERRVLEAALHWHRLNTSVNAEALHHYCAELLKEGAWRLV